MYAIRSYYVSEAFFRDLIATTFGLQYLDNFIVSIIYTLESQRDTLDGDMLDLLMSVITSYSIHYTKLYE